LDLVGVEVLPVDGVRLEEQRVDRKGEEREGFGTQALEGRLGRCGVVQVNDGIQGGPPNVRI
jgi:hypothetical protein